MKFTSEEVCQIIFKAKQGKAPRVDGLISDIYRNEASVTLLTELFNKCMSDNVIPNVWRLGIISPIPKSSSSDQGVPLNYRGISLLPVTAKLFTALISKCLSKYLEDNQLLADEQNGFRPNRSALDHIFSLNIK